jgi:S1-C subfamily serine protease
MNATHRQKIFIGLMVLFLVMLACGPTPTSTSTPKQQGNTPAAVVMPTAEANTPAPAPADTGTLTQAQRSQLAHATVRIWGVKVVGSQVKPVYHGSGTLISPGGLILTNCHVADPIAMGFPQDLKPDALVIDLISTEAKPPVSTYLAKVVTEDPTLDLATIQIVANLDGSDVNQSSLNLPSVPLGDSDQVKFGDPLFVFGYPGIGGDTITYVTGDVSGFDSEDPIGDRAWIKTDATIAGGNSGGLATNSRGQIIGVPSQVSTGTASEPTDCRRIQDTNGDGNIDQNDACVVTGGFINGIRPINWALPLIKAAQSGQAYTSPYGNPVVNNPTPNAPSPSANAQFTLVGWAEQTDQNGCPENPTNDFPSGTKTIAAVFSYTGMTNGEPIQWDWFLDGKDVNSKPETWKGGNQGDCFSFSLSNGSDSLPDGDYALQVSAGANQVKVAQAQTSIGKASPVNPISGGVILTGQITDADTGRGIAGIFFAVLKPGVDPNAWVNNPQEDQVLTYAVTDADGNYQMPVALTRGQKYGIVVGNNKLGYPSVTAALTIKSDAPDTVNLPIKLSK